MTAALKDAALAALVALVLAVPLVGLHTVDSGGSLVLATRWPAVAIGVAGVFVGRLLLTWLRSVRGPRQVSPDHAKPALEPRKMWWIGAVLILLALVLPVLPGVDRYVIDAATSVLIYVMLGWGLNIVVGLAGLLDLGYVAFYAVGAYTYALLSQNFGLSFWFCLPLAGLFAAAFGVALGFPVMRLRGDYLAIVTLGFGEMIRIVLINWQSLTKGPNGISGLARPSFFGLPFARSSEPGETAFHEFFGLEYSTQHRVVFLYFLILALALATNFLVLRLRRLPIGRAWEALREDEIACKSLGINPTMVKLSAFGLGAMLGGFAGAFFATRAAFVSPESFTFTESAIILAIVVLGGMGSQIGVVLAAAFLVLLPEIGRDFAQYRMVLFGAAMVGVMVWRPNGLLSGRHPTVRLGAAKPRPAEQQIA